MWVENILSVHSSVTSECPGLWQRAAVHICGKCNISRCSEELMVQAGMIPPGPGLPHNSSKKRTALWPIGISLASPQSWIHLGLHGRKGWVLWHTCMSSRLALSETIPGKWALHSLQNIYPLIHLVSWLQESGLIGAWQVVEVTQAGNSWLCYWNLEFLAGISFLQLQTMGNTI